MNKTTKQVITSAIEARRLRIEHIVKEIDLRYEATRNFKADLERLEREVSELNEALKKGK